MGVGIDRALERRGEARAAQHPQPVLGEALLGVADRAHHLRLEIALPAERIDATAGAFPDFVQILFNGWKTIDHVIVYTLQDNLASPVEPTDIMTFSSFGVTAFTVQGWNGSAWG